MARTIDQLSKRKISELNRQELEAEVRNKGGSKIDPTHMTDSEIHTYLMCGELPIGHQYVGEDVPSHGRINKIHGCK